MAQQIGQVLTGVMAKEGQSTALQPQLDMQRIDFLLATPAADLTAEDCRELRAWAEMGATIATVTPAQITRHFEFLAATLPRAATDIETGMQRFAVYAKLLGNQTNDALSYMTERACKELDWFPTPRQCLAFLDDYRPPETKQGIVLRLCADSAQIRFDRFIEALAEPQTQDWIDSHPEQWRRIAVERGYLQWDGGKMTRRNLQNAQAPM